MDWPGKWIDPDPLSRLITHIVEVKKKPASLPGKLGPVNQPLGSYTSRQTNFHKNYYEYLRKVSEDM